VRIHLGFECSHMDLRVEVVGTSRIDQLPAVASVLCVRQTANYGTVDLRPIRM